MKINFNGDSGQEVDIDNDTFPGAIHIWEHGKRGEKKGLGLLINPNLRLKPIEGDEQQWVIVHKDDL